MNNIVVLPVKRNGGVASQELLHSIHKQCAEHFHKYLTETPRAKQRASMLHVIVRFLKDNGVEHADSVKALEALSRPARDELQAQTIVSLDGLEVPFK